MAQKQVISANLSKEQLRKLAKVMYYKGAQAIHTMKFRSHYERVKFLKDCKDTYFATLDLMNITDSAVKDFEGHEYITPVVKAYAEYVHKSIEFAHKAIQFYSKRAEHIRQLKKYADNVLKWLYDHKVSIIKRADISELTHEIAVLSNVMLKYEAQAASLTARKFYRAARASGQSFQLLLRRSQFKPGIKGALRKLMTEKQLQVLNEMIESRGARKLAKLGNKAIEGISKHGGKAVFVLTALAAAVDIYSSDPDQMYETAVKSVVTVGTSFLIGELEGLIFAEVVLALSSTGPIGVIVGAIIVGAALWVAGNKVQDLIETEVLPVLVNFMNDHKEEVKTLALGIASVHPITAILKATGAIDPHEFTPTDAVLLALFGPVTLIFRELFRKKGGSANPKPPPPISTHGITVRGPQLPDGRVLALQIASKA